MEHIISEHLPLSLIGLNDIPGWLSEREGAWLHKQARTRPRILEIGCWKGRSTYALCTSCPGLVCTVDHFAGTEDEDRFWYDNAHGNFAGVRSAFLLNMKQFLDSGKLLLFDMLVSDFYTVFPAMLRHHRFDMIFIDGAHNTPAVSQDIIKCSRLLAPGGLLCGHDAQHKGVKPALKELLPDYKIFPTTSIWYTGPNELYAH